MQVETAIGTAMRRAGVQVGVARLFALACDLLRKANRNPVVAHDSFVEAVEKDAEMLRDLFGLDRKTIEQRAMAYLEARARDMAPQRPGAGQRLLKAAEEAREIVRAGIPAPQASRDERGGGVQSGSESQCRVGAAAKNEEGEVRLTSAARQKPGFPSSSPVGSGAVPPGHAVFPPLGRSASTPGNAKRGIEGLRALKKYAPSIFDTTKLRDGMAIGDVQWFELDGRIGANAREAALLRLVRNHAKPADQTMRVRDVIKVADLQRMMQQAAEEADANN